MPPEKRHRRGARVLVVDDEPALARAVKRLLVGHRVALESDGASALARLRAGERFDAIICDLMMPKLSGMELHQALQELAPNQAANIIFVSGGAYTSEARAFLARATNPHLTKPFDGEKLLDAVDALVANGED